MKAFAITVALLGAATAAPISAQHPTRSGVVVGTTQRTNCGYTRSGNSVGDIVFGRASTVNCRDVYSREDGAWYQVGRGPNNNSTYERRVRDANGNLVIQHARRNPNGTFTILNTRVARGNDKQWKKAQKEERKVWKKQEKTEDKQMKNQVSKSDYKDWKKGEKADNKQTDADYKAASKGNKGKNK
jgi:hypothetical protein